MSYPFLNLAKVNEPFMDEMVSAADRVIRTGRYIGGPEVESLEHELSEYLHAHYAIGVSNGLDALRLILRAWILMGLMQPGDKVIVAANTYVASILAITDAGLKPVLVDPDPNTFNISAQGIMEALDDRTKCVMPVHLYGRVAWDGEILRVIRDNGLLVIEDCAQAIGARSTTEGLFGSYMAGALGHAGALSFYPTKNTGALGDAGAVITHDRELADTVRALSNYGSDYRYHNLYQGYNCRLDSIQAAMLRVKLPHNDAENELRRIKADAYNACIEHPDIIKPVLPGNPMECVWHQYVIRVTDGKRDMLRQRLSEQGVGTDIHYAVPPHLQPCYAGLPHAPLPVTEELATQVLSLPVARGTTVRDVTQISSIINNIRL